MNNNELSNNAHLLERIAELEDELAKSKRKVAELLFKDNELTTNYKTIIDSINDSLFLAPFSLNGCSNFIDVNDTACKKYGYSREELLNLSFENIAIQQEAKKHITKDKIKKFSEKQWAIVESKHKTKNGDIFPVEINARIFKLDGKDFVISVVRDITERLKENSLLRESEEKFRLLANHTNDWEYWIDTEGKYQYLSPACEKITGYKIKEFYSDPDLLFNIVVDKDREHVKKHFHDENSSKSKEQKIMEFQIIRKDGEKLWIEHRCTPMFDKDGNYIGRRGNNRNISRRKKALNDLTDTETMFENVFHASPDSISISRLTDGVYVNVNDGFVEISGFKREEVIGISSKEINIWANFEDRDDFIKEILEKGEINNLKAEFRTKHGKQIFALLSARIIMIDRVKHLLVVGRDITEEILLQRKLIESEEKFRTLFENHSAIKLIINPENGDIVNANKAAARFYQWSVDELKKMNISQINISPRKYLNDAIKKVTENKQNYFEFQHRKANGDVHHVEVFSSKVVLEGGKTFLHSIVQDVTEKKKAFEELNILSRAVEQSPASIVITDDLGTIEYVNPKFEAVTGYSFDEAKGKTPSILKSGEHTKEFYKELWGTILSGKEWHGRFRNRKKNGELYWDSAQISPIKDSDNEITHFVLIAEDITERIEQEKRMRKMEYILNETQSISKVGGWEYKISEERTIWTKETYKIYGVPEDTKVSPEFALGFYEENDRKKLVDAFNKCIKSGKEYSLNLNIINNHGNKLCVSTSGKAIYKDGKIVKVVGNIADITEKQKTEKALAESEERYRVTTEATGDVFYRLHFDDMKYDYIHPNIEKLTGYTAEELNLQKITIQSERLGKLLSFSEMKQERESGLTEMFIADYLIKTKDGKEVWIADNSFPLFDDNNNVIGTHGVLRDITERKLLEKNIIKAKEEAESADNMKSVFLAQMSHEIRTPINAIVSMTSLIKNDMEDFISEDIEQEFEIIERASERIIRTIDLLINLSELQAGTYKPKTEKINLYSDIIYHVVVDKKRIAKKNNTKIKMQENLKDYQITADYFSVNQIMIQLIDNAVKYTQNGEVNIIIGKNDSGKTFVEISDTGIGIDEDYLPRLFEPFTQEEMGYTRRFEGNGIGMALVKQYCDLNNFTIEVESTKGVGTKLTITF